MTNPFLKAMQPKKKRPVDPNAPPRPNLLSHEKVLKDTKVTMDQMEQQVRRLQSRVEQLESKLVHQTQYLQALHNTLQNRSRNKRG
jgi:TolA-binding protein